MPAAPAEACRCLQRMPGKATAGRGGALSYPQPTHPKTLQGHVHVPSIVDAVAPCHTWVYGQQHDCCPTVRPSKGHRSCIMITHFHTSHDSTLRSMSPCVTHSDVLSPNRSGGVCTWYLAATTKPCDTSLERASRAKARKTDRPGQVSDGLCTPWHMQRSDGSPHV